MRTEQLTWAPARGWSGSNSELGEEAQLVFVFGGTDVLRDPAHLKTVRGLYPEASIVGCSTAGEISGTTVSDDSIVATAVHFEHTEIRGVSAAVAEPAQSHDTGEKLVRALAGDDLVHVFVISSGLHVNGSELVRGITENLPADVTVTGGLSGDGTRFEETLVLLDDDARPDRVAAIGFYGDRLFVGYGSLGGWDPFGPQRLITRAEGNVLYELDGQPALDLYKRYLGSHADELPASAMYFPLAITVSEDREPVVRTILGVNDEDGSLTTAGDVPEGAVARLMKGNFDRLIDGAAGAARACSQPSSLAGPGLAVLISCVGRKVVLKHRVEEEVEAVWDELGRDTTLTGFYSYGEISPFVHEARCELHNQTMTITTFSEA